jgi:hypothetical protein
VSGRLSVKSLGRVRPPEVVLTYSRECVLCGLGQVISRTPFCQGEGRRPSGCRPFFSRRFAIGGSLAGTSRRFDSCQAHSRLARSAGTRIPPMITCAGQAAQARVVLAPVPARDLAETGNALARPRRTREPGRPEAWLS